jgi:hypothetical protein
MISSLCGVFTSTALAPTLACLLALSLLPSLVPHNNELPLTLPFALPLALVFPLLLLLPPALALPLPAQRLLAATVRELPLEGTIIRFNPLVISRRCTVNNTFAVSTPCGLYSG